ncbi:transporter [Flavobacterium rivuli WB 3.3-2 = DSM 21788]|uniref:Transporter n=1 Tax=Flavobacterium rivuli WB 3.3-2 = DSM 21788 TaxID=1121895 RepID=A0A0A2M643_9FLAO|nr:multidrug efflux SMR transporter [Flavobacterium rivuli]KGO86928.1 transporter [Flavobacterium rivuli WB 3.3-2 = DSM 21788]
MKYVFLALAIILEVAGSSLLKAGEQFTKIIPSSLAILSYVACFYFLSMSLKHIPLGTAYAIWAGLGIVLTVGASVVIFKQSLDLPAVIGIVLIIAGVVVLNFFSKSAAH